MKHKIQLIFHAGLNKTGSTSIQSSLRQNKAALLAQGILVPDTGIKFVSRHHLFLALENNEYTNLVDDLYQEAVDKKCHTIIMSEESLNKSSSFKKHEYFKKYFSDIKFVFYLRRQDTLLESHYNQTIKVPWQKSRSIEGPETLLKFAKTLAWLHYDKLLDAFADIFGKKSVVAIPFERGQVPANIAEHFLADICGIDCSNLNMKMRKDNTSLPYASLGMARKINEFNMDLLAKPGFIRKSIHAILRDHYTDSSSLIIDYEKRQRLMNHYRAGNEYVAKHYLNREEGKLFYLPLPGKNQNIQNTELSEKDEDLFRAKIITLLRYLSKK